jgi:4-amino-4-deoxy-L-arabinose transferase-like glycosyltransferase
MHIEENSVDQLTRTPNSEPMPTQAGLLAQVFVFWRDHPGVVIFAAALTVRVVFILAYGASAPPVTWGDDHAYDAIATRLVTKHELGNTFYPLGYPLFLALIYAVLGRHWFVVRLFQGALSAATCVLTYRLGTKVFGDRVGRLAGLLLVFYPGDVYMSWRLMAETLFIFLLLLALNTAIRMARRPAIREAIALGLIVGVAQLVKSNLYVLPAFLVAWSALALSGSIRRRLVLVCGFAGSFLLVSLVTPVGNFLSIGGGASVVPGNAGYTLWEANNPVAPLADGYSVVAETEPAGKAFIEAQGLTARLAQADEFEKNRLYAYLGLAWIRESPGRFLVLCLKKLNNAFGLFPRAATFEGSRTTETVHLLSYGLIAPFALVGMITARRHWFICAPLFLVLLSYVFMVLLFYGTPRYTVIVMPVLIVFASSALWTCADHLARTHPELVTEGEGFGLSLWRPTPEVRERDIIHYVVSAIAALGNTRARLIAQPDCADQQRGKDRCKQ